MMEVEEKITNQEEVTKYGVNKIRFNTGDTKDGKIYNTETYDSVKNVLKFWQNRQI